MREQSDEEIRNYVRANVTSLTYRPGEVYNFENKEFYDVSRIIADIKLDDSNFKLGTIRIDRLWPQVEGSGGIDHSYLDRIPDSRMFEPVIMITYENGAGRLIDGYHRLVKARMLKAELVVAYVLTWEQTKLYSLDPDQMPGHVRL